MSWILIDEDKCTNCGICVKRCARVFSEADGKILADANDATCNLCGHCMSLCAPNAITHQTMDMGSFTELDKELNIETSLYIKFLQRRRSHRAFFDKPVPRQDLETLINVSTLAPTGSNVQSVEIVMVENPETIKKYSDLTVDYFKDMIASEPIRAKEYQDRNEELPPDLKRNLEVAQSRQGLIDARDAGLDPIFHKAPAVMIFHSITPTSTPKDNCILAAHTIALTAMTMGLETCYIGLFEAAANLYPPMQKELNLPPNHVVGSVLILGYPRMKFFRTVDRKPVKVRWE